MESIILYIPLISGLILLALSVWALLKPAFTFWPPSAKRSWQYRTFLVLFRVMVYGVVILSARHLWAFGLASTPWQTILAALLFFGGIGLAFWATFGLGWKTAFGAQDQLRTNGAFAISRNPIYVATWAGLIGWGILIPDLPVRAALACWASLYGVATLLEERWLRQHYGKDFETYCETTRRFL